MKCRSWPIVAALLLAGCGEQEAAAPTASASEPAQRAEREVTGPERRILAFGDSLFAGYGLEEGQGYPDVLQAALRRRGIDATVIDAGVSGDTSAAGLARAEFVLDGLDAPPDLAIVEFGGNDLLRGISPEETRANLRAILDELGERRIPVLVMGMRAPPNLGEAYVAAFDAIYPELAERAGAALVPFFIEPIYGRPGMTLPDRIHPSAQGVEALVAATVDDVEAALPDE